MTSKIDGSDERVVYTDHSALEYSPAWSPDGQSIVIINHLPAGGEYKVVNPATGAVKKLFTAPQNLEPALSIWLPTGDALLLLIRDLGSGRNQIAYLSYPGAAYRKITNDTSNYGSLAVASDGKTIATVLYTLQSEDQVFSVDSPPDLARAMAVGNGSWLDWIDNNRLLIAETEGYSLQTATLDGQRSVLLPGSDLHSFDATVCGGGSILFSGEPLQQIGQTRIYSLDLDGSNLRQLSPGPADQFARCSADGKWIAYTDFTDASVKRLRRDTGKIDTMIAPTRNPYPHLGISSDGTQIVAVTNTHAQGSSSLSFVSFESAQTTKEITISGAPQTPVAVPGGKYIAYLIHDRGVDNVWRQPVEGGAPKQWSNFRLNRETASFIYAMAWSPDGKRFAIAHSAARGNAALLHDEGK